MATVQFCVYVYRSLPSDKADELFDSGTGTSCSSESPPTSEEPNNNKRSKEASQRKTTGENNNSSPLSIDKELYILNKKIESIQMECDAMMRREETTPAVAAGTEAVPSVPKVKPPTRPSHLELSPIFRKKDQPPLCPLSRTEGAYDEPLYSLPIDDYAAGPVARKSVSPPTPPRNYVKGRPPTLGSGRGAGSRRNLSEPRLTDIASPLLASPSPSVGPSCFKLPWESHLILQEKKSAASKLAEWTRKLREKTTRSKEQSSPLRRIASLGRRSSFRERSSSTSKVSGAVSIESDLGKHAQPVSSFFF